MRNSIDSAMAAARAFTARNPGQPLSVVFFNAKPTVALPLTTDPDQVAKVLAKAPKLAEGTHIYDALAAAVAQVRGSALGAARIVLLSDGDDVGSAHLARLRPPAARGAEHPRLLRRHRVAGLHPGRPREDRRRDRRRVRVRRLAGGAHGGLRGARLPARERVPRQLPLAGEPRSGGRRQHRRRRRRGARLVLVPRARTRGRQRPMRPRSAIS